MAAADIDKMTPSGANQVWAPVPSPPALIGKLQQPAWTVANAQPPLRYITLSPHGLRRLGTIMEPVSGNPHEVEGVLNPAAARGPDGHLYLLPRLVGTGNFSRIGLARVLFNRRGEPRGVRRMGLVLKPEALYELNRTGGGVEDPRVTYLAGCDRYVMTYTAHGPTGPRIAAALSGDLLTWQRTGPVRFDPLHSIDLAEHDNKDALLFPEPVPGPDGRPALALIHRPDFRALQQDRADRDLIPDDLRGKPSMWISFAPLEEIGTLEQIRFGQHHLLIAPQTEWERLKVGGGTPPVRVPGGWLVLYHGVSGRVVQGVDQQLDIHYSAGALLLDAADPRQVLYRTSQSILTPDMPAERVGIVPNVVFPTGVDLRPDGILDIYYGMADSRIGVARTTLTHLLEASAAAAA
jgi:predicted GH43/DUF377 family glycosyl hydrolase